MVQEQSAASGSMHGRFLMQAARERRALFLIDGMDEAGDARDSVEAFVAELLMRGHRVVVTSRKTGFTAALRQQFSGEHRDERQIVQLLPLSRDQQEAMVSSRVDTEQCAAFWDGARDPRYEELTENPLMLTMMLSVFGNMGGRLPERRSELYEAALDGMLNRADALRKAERSLGRTHLEPFLQQLAFASHVREGDQFRIFTGGDVRAWGKEDGEMDEGMLEVWRRARTMVEEEGTLPIVAPLGMNARGEAEFRFSHLTFQEYYCAAELERRFQSGSQPVSVLLRQQGRPCAAHALEDARWHVVLQVCVELLESKDRLRPFAEAMLACDGHKLALGAGVGDPGARALAPMLHADRVLVEMDLSKAELGVDGARDIGAAVAGPGGSTALQTVVVAEFKHVVQTLRTAGALDLSRKKLQAPDAGLLAGAMKAGM